MTELVCFGRTFCPSIVRFGKTQQKAYGISNGVILLSLKMSNDKLLFLALHDGHVTVTPQADSPHAEFS
jgi:hypothetical protein